MHKIVAVILGVLMLALISLPAPANAATDCKYGSISTKVHWGAGDKYPAVNSYGKIYYKVCQHSSPKYVTFYRITGSHNFEGTHMFCNPESGATGGTKVRYKFGNGDTRTIHVPCTTDTTNKASRRIYVRFNAPNPCAVSPCYAAAKVTPKHTLVKYGAPDRNHTMSTYLVS